MTCLRILALIVILNVSCLFSDQTVHININAKMPVIPLEDEQEIFSLNVAKLIEFIYKNKYSCTIGEAYRTEEQSLIYAKEGKGIVNSLHKKRLAVDLNIFTAAGKYLSKTEDYKIFGAYWESLHPKNKWGGRFKSRPDGNHFQMTI